MKTVVISLARRVDRRADFERWNRGQPLSFSFMTAFDGERIEERRLVAGGLLAEDERNFGKAALANALSHATLWRDCAAGREPYFILEDDVCLRGDFWRHAKPLLERHLAAADLIALGYNTDSVVALQGSDGVVSAMRFDETAKRRPGYFDAYARLHDQRPNLLRCVQFWGLLAYAVTPQGAARLLANCLPLSSCDGVPLIGTDRVVRPYGLDSMVNLALARGRVRACAAYPALALGPNSQATSDIQTAASPALVAVGGAEV